jgi:hypothetical protein
MFMMKFLKASHEKLLPGPDENLTEINCWTREGGEILFDENGSQV